jgi:hypothetical protein
MARKGTNALPKAGGREADKDQSPHGTLLLVDNNGGRWPANALMTCTKQELAKMHYQKPAIENRVKITALMGELTLN